MSGLSMPPPSPFKASKTEAIAGVITTVLPSVISLVQALFVQQNPGQPPPTSVEVILAFNSAVAKSLAADDVWLAGHPKT
jgi:hypothetical protein